MPDNNFSPNVTCPHCGKVRIVNISGFARKGLSTRTKTCAFCHKDFTVNIYVETSKDQDDEALLSSINSKIEGSKRAIKASIVDRLTVLSILEMVRDDRDNVIKRLFDNPIGSC